MADITVQLAWYRLGETYKSVAETWHGLTRSYEQFSLSRVDVLDMLFLGWLLAAFVVIAVVNLYVRFVKSRRGLAAGSRAATDGGGFAARVSGGETVRWLNEALAWLGEHQQVSWIVERWLKALTDEAKKHSERADVQVRFDKSDIGQKMAAAAVEFGVVSTDSTNSQLLSVHASVAISDVSLSVAVVTSTVTSLQTVTCDVQIVKLQGIVQVQSQSSGEVVSIKFQSTPHLQLHLIPSDYASVDHSSIESVVRSAICGFKLELPLPSGASLSNSADLLTANHVSTLHSSRSQTDKSSSGEDRHRMAGVDRSAQNEMVRQWQRDRDKQQQQQQHNSMDMEQKLVAASARSDGRLPGPLTNSNKSTSRDRRLLVKMIKANGLMGKDFAGSCDPYCTVTADDPPQQHMTSVVKNTINPFFDEHFLLNITDLTKQLKFEVYDRNKAKAADEFLGRAVISIDDLRHTPSSRQIIPLTGKVSSLTTTSGSVTVEFLLMEAAANESTVETMRQTTEMLSAPFRYIETSHTMMPGGTLVTTSTTTTDRQRTAINGSDFNGQLAYNESPIRVEKSETSSTYTSQNSGLTGQPSNVDVNSRPPGWQGRVVNSGTDGVTGVALQELSNQQRSLQPKSTTITLTGRPKEQAVPVIKTVQASSNDDPVHQQNSTSNQQTETKKKSFANAFKKRFSRINASSKQQDRAQSADRVAAFRDDSLLRPPDSPASFRIPEESDLLETASARKSRSHSLSASFRNLFHRGKKTSSASGGSTAVSRESSVSRTVRDSSSVPHDGITAGSVIVQPSPQLSTSSRHRTSPEYPYNMSMPSKVSPLYQQ
jgi:hypothetical protein